MKTISKSLAARFAGVFPPLVSPFGRRGEMDEGRFKENLSRLAGAGLGGVLIAGSTGEAPYLTASERLRMVELARRFVRPPEMVIAGTGLESARETLALSREAAARGADALLVVTPHYFRSRMDAAALTAYYQYLADQLPRPVILYHIPQFTGIRMAPQTIAALARHPGILGMKDSSGDLSFVRAVLRRVPRAFRVVVGAGAIFLDALRAGAVGGVLGQANFAPELCVGIYEAFRRKRWKAARDLQARLALLVRETSNAYGVAGVKAAMDLCGFRGGAPRLPLLEASGAARRRIAAALRQSRAGLDF
jgi:dihydrodipicolinate synthase/N-acetylneuraminate lyase